MIRSGRILWTSWPDPCAKDDTTASPSLEMQLSTKEVTVSESPTATQSLRDDFNDASPTAPEVGKEASMRSQQRLVRAQKLCFIAYPCLEDCLQPGQRAVRRHSRGLGKNKRSEVSLQFTWRRCTDKPQTLKFAVPRTRYLGLVWKQRLVCVGVPPGLLIASP